MSISLFPVSGTPAVAPVSSSVSSSVASTGFASAMASAIQDVESTQADAQSKASDLLINGRGDVHTVALAAQDAELRLELFQQVRNKFVAAYQEIMKMPI